MSNFHRFSLLSNRVFLLPCSANSLLKRSLSFLSQMGEAFRALEFENLNSRDKNDASVPSSLA